MQNTEKIYKNWLCYIPGMGRKKVESILAGGRTAQWLHGAKKEEVENYLREAYRAAGLHEGYAAADTKKILQAGKLHSPEGLYEDLKKREIRVLFREEEEFPARLKEIPDAPIALYRMGKGTGVAHSVKPVVAVVGTRNCSEYGKAMAKRIGELCAEMGIPLVSGLASGIDGISQWWALKNGGDVAAVLGCGVDVCYPWENKGIYAALLEKGQIYSEYIPGTRPKSHFFPPRNRIISGLSDAVIVVEAKEKSGTLITVDMALEQGRDVYVVPGRITDPMSAGCNRLIAQGAEMIVNPEKTLSEILAGTSFRADAKNPGTTTEVPVVTSGLHNYCNYHNYTESLDPLSQKIYQIVDFSPLTVQQIFEKLKEEEMGKMGDEIQSEGLENAPSGLRQMQQKLLRLEMEGIIFERDGRFFRKS